MAVSKGFNTIVASLRAGHYTRVKPDGSEIGYRFDNRITDDADLFNEASKTLLYYWCLANGEERWRQYYDHVCIPNDAPDMSLKGVPFEQIIAVISPDALTDWSTL